MPSRQPTSRSCFVCGRENPVGLKVKWDEHPEAGEIRGTVTIPEHFNGYPGVTHGGIVGARPRRDRRADDPDGRGLRGPHGHREARDRLPSADAHRSAARGRGPAR